MKTVLLVHEYPNPTIIEGVEKSFPNDYIVTVVTPELLGDKLGTRYDGYALLIDRGTVTCACVEKILATFNDEERPQLSVLQPLVLYRAGISTVSKVGQLGDTLQRMIAALTEKK